LVLTVRLRMDTVHSAITEPVRRLEIFTGGGRRRKWSEEDKARIVAEIVASGDLCRGSTPWVIAAAVVWLAPPTKGICGRAF